MKKFIPNLREVIWLVEDYTVCEEYSEEPFLKMKERKKFVYEKNQ